MSDESPYWDTRIGCYAKNVLPGDYFVTDRADLAVVTLLGSCVAACVRDVRRGCGGLNHFLLPDEGPSGGADNMRYGAYAMEMLINGILRTGGQRQDLEAKVFGGGRVIASSSAETVGDRNGKFVLDYLRREGVQVAASDLGGMFARRVFFFPSTGRVSVQRIDRSAAADVAALETRARTKAVAQPETNDVELFV